MTTKISRLSFRAFLLSVCFLLSPQILAAEQWRWENPLPQGNKLNSIWAAADNNVIAVGNRGTILQFDGNQWQPHQSSTIQNLNGVWGSSANDIYAVGETDGGSSGSIALHYDGNGWSEIDIGSDQTLYTAWGFNANDVYIGGWNGRLYHFDGSQWTWISNGSNKHIYGVWGSSPSNVITVGANGTIRRFNGSWWSGMSLPDYSYDLTGIWGTAEDNVYAVGGKYENSSYHSIILHYDGTQWNEVQAVSGYSLSSISGLAADDIYATSAAATGIDPVILHYDGIAWGEVGTGVTDGLGLSAGVITATDNALFVGNLGNIVRWDGSSFAQMRQGNQSHLLGLWCGSDNASIAVGANGSALHYDGTGWSAKATGLSSAIRAVWGDSNNQVFAVGGAGQIIYYDGIAWTSMTSGTSENLRSIWGSSASDVFVGGDGVILHYDGQAWSSMALPLLGPQWDYVGIWGSSPTDVYAVSYGGDLLHYDGLSWTEQTTPLPGYQDAIWGTAADDIQVSGGFGSLYRFDGSIWSEMPGPTMSPNAITATDADNYYYAGSFGRVRHYDGSIWTDLEAPTTLILHGVCMRSDGSVVVAGNWGAILRYGLVDALPVVTIDSPADGAEFSEDDGAIGFSASASDVEDGDLTTAIAWSSDVDGAFTSPAILSVGTHQIAASVSDSAGQTGSSTITITITPHVNQDPVVVITAPADASVFEAGSSITLAASAADAEDGDISHLIGWSSSLDGALTSPAVLSSGTHVLTAMVSDSDGGSASASVNVIVNAPPGPPIADAGPDQTVDEGMTVSLSGSGTDANGTIVGYSWSQVAGPVVPLIDADTATPSFTAPAVTAATALEFTLTVTDNDNLSASDAVLVTVNNVNALPTVDAGPAQSVDEGVSVNLAGSASDSDGSIVGYQWQQTGGPAVALQNATSASAIFTAPGVSAATTLTFLLTVTDNDNASASDSVSVTVNNVAVAQYCASSGNSQSYEWIESIGVDGSSNASGKGSGYSDFTGQVFNLVKGGSHGITLTPGFRSGSYTERWRVWIDLNANGVFEGSEQLFSSSSSSSIVSNINIPASAASGNTRMRISMAYGSYPPACGNFTYGEVEDYTVNIQ